MEQKGKLIQCDRCGKTHFLKLIGETSLSGGYERYDKFEETPSDWGTLSFSRERKPGNMLRLCNNCISSAESNIYKWLQEKGDSK